jgi:hypothetical protein
MQLPVHDTFIIRLTIYRSSLISNCHGQHWSLSVQRLYLMIHHMSMTGFEMNATLVVSWMKRVRALMSVRECGSTEQTILLMFVRHLQSQMMEVPSSSQHAYLGIKSPRHHRLNFHLHEQQNSSNMVLHISPTQTITLRNTWLCQKKFSNQ